MKDDGTVDGDATRHIRAKKALQRPFVILKKNSFSALNFPWGL